MPSDGREIEPEATVVDRIALVPLCIATIIVLAIPVLPVLWAAIDIVVHFFPEATFETVPGAQVLQVNHQFVAPCSDRFQYTWVVGNGTVEFRQEETKPRVTEINCTDLSIGPESATIEIGPASYFKLIDFFVGYAVVKNYNCAEVIRGSVLDGTCQTLLSPVYDPSGFPVSIIGVSVIGGLLVLGGFTTLCESISERYSMRQGQYAVAV